MDYRAEKMLEMFKNGSTLQEIGNIYSISRERVRQLLSQCQDYSRNVGGNHRKHLQNVEVKKALKQEKRKQRILNRRMPRSEK